MTDASSEFKDFHKEGNRVWIKVWDPDRAEAILADKSSSKKKKDKNKAPAQFVWYGQDGDLFYAGYQHLGTATFLLFHQVEGGGKKTKLTETISINAVDVRQMGVIKQASQSDLQTP